MTRDGVRQLALARPETVEADHHGIASFRVGGKIFCTLQANGRTMMVKLDPEDQRNLVEAHPGVIEPVPGYWGRKGSTFVAFAQADEALIATLLQMAWTNVAPARLKRSR